MSGNTWYKIIDTLETDVHARKEVWLDICTQFGAAYRQAFANLNDHLPKSLNTMPHSLHWAPTEVLGGLYMTVAGTPGIARFFMKPVLQGVDDLLRRVGKPRPTSMAGLASTALRLLPVSPADYDSEITSSVRRFFIDVIKNIGDAKRRVRLNRSAVGSTEHQAIMKQLLASPYWYEPEGWRAIHKRAITPDLEKTLWSLWAKQLPLERESIFHGSPIAEVDLATVHRRLAFDLNMKWAHKFNDYFASQEMLVRMPTFGASPALTSFPFARAMRDWGRAYKPDKRFGSPLPLAVREFMRREAVGIVRNLTEKLFHPLKKLRTQSLPGDSPRSD